MSLESDEGGDGLYDILSHASKKGQFWVLMVDITRFMRFKNLRRIYEDPLINSIARANATPTDQELEYIASKVETAFMGLDD